MNDFGGLEVSLNDFALYAVLAIWIFIAGITLAMCISPKSVDHLLDCLIKPKDDIEDNS